MKVGFQRLTNFGGDYRKQQVVRLLRMEELYVKSWGYGKSNW